MDLLLDVNHLYCEMKRNGNKRSVRNEKRSRSFKVAHLADSEISAELE